LGCGAELPRGGGHAIADEATPQPAAPNVLIEDEQTSVGGTVSQLPPDPKPSPPAQPAAKAPAPEADAATPAAGLPPGKCPECDYVNPPTNRFCASCGFRLDEAPKP